MNGEHEAFEELAVGWALHALEPEDETAFAGHLESCDRCARTVAETTEVMASLATDLPVAEPPADLRRRLRAAVQKTEQLPSRPGPAAEPDIAAGFPDGDGVPAPGPPRAAWQRVGPVGLAVAALAVIAGLGIWSIALGESRTATQATAAAQGRIIDAVLVPGRATIAPVADEDGRTVATVVARHGQLQVVTDGLPVNDAARRTYVVWGMRQGAPVALGTFDVVHSQMDVRTVGSSRTGLDEFTAYGVSIEPGRQAPSAPTEIVGMGQVTS